MDWSSDIAADPPTQAAQTNKAYKPHAQWNNG
jgi:hypothetical protein